MSELSSKFNREDIETLLEAMNDWELIGNQEFHVLQMIKSAPLPPEDHEAFEVMAQIKDHFRRREKDIMDSRVTRQEKAVFLKAKLMLVRRDMGIDQLFDMAASTDLVDAPPSVASPVSVGGGQKVPVTSEVDQLRKRLELAEYYIKDLGDKVWEFYEKFLAERASGEG